MEQMLNIKINGKPLQVPYGTTVLEAARMAKINIPTLCYLKDINEIGACRMCLVEVKGARGLVTACNPCRALSGPYGRLSPAAANLPGKQIDRTWS